MSRIPFTALSRSLRIPLTIGATLAAMAVGGSAWAEEATPAATPTPAEASSVATPGPTDELGFIQVIGATTASEELQWVNAAEAAQPDKADLPEISASEWLPASQD
jgi:hypothetical protein